MINRYYLFFIAVLLLSLLFGPGCGSSSGGGGGSQGGSSGSGSGNKGTILITAPFPSKAAVRVGKKGIQASRFIPLTVYIYVVTVCEQGTTTAVVTPININRPQSGDTVDASISNVPIGWKTVRVAAYDSGRNLLAQGASDVEVKASDYGSSDVSVTLTSTSDPPSVSSTTPSGNQTGVSINSKVTVLFSMTLLASSLDKSTFYLKNSQGNVDGAVTLEGSTAVFTPASDLLPLTSYTAVVSGNIKNTAGLAMGTDYTWSFTTGEKPDTTPPQVKETSPSNGAGNIDTGTTISAVFTKNIDPATVTSSTFTVTSAKAAVQGASSGRTAVNNTASGRKATQNSASEKTAVQGTISTLGNSVTFVPSTALQAGTAHTVTLSGSIKDLAGNAMGTDYSWSFTTQSSGGGGGGGGGGGSTGSWHRDVPKPTFETINDIWVTSSEAVAVGDNGVILRFNGSTWVPISSGTSSHLNSIWYDGSANYYIVGAAGTMLVMSASAPYTVSPMTGAPAVDLWGIYGNSGPPVTFFVVGAGGAISYYNGTVWSPKNVASGPDFLGVWCDTNDVVAVGTGGGIYHLTGGSPWAGSFSQEAPTITSNTLTSVWGTSYIDLHITGYSGTYIYRDNVGYNNYSPSGMTGIDFNGVWGASGSGYVNIVGCNGTILTNVTANDYSVLTSVSSGTNNQLRGVMGSSSSDIFTVGYNGTALHSGGSSWSVSPGTIYNLYTVWADPSSGKAIAAGQGGTALEFDSSAWKCLNSGTLYEFRGVCGSSITSVLGVVYNTSGAGSADFYSFNDSSTSWSSHSSIPSFNPEDIWCRSGTDFYVVGTNGANTQVYRWNTPVASTWNLVGAAISGFSGLGIWGPSTGSDIYISGTSGTSPYPRIYHFDGLNWNSVYNNSSISLQDIWGTSSGSIWSVGWMGAAVNWNGSAWSSTTIDAGANFRGVWGDSSRFFAVGFTGVIYYYNGSSWTSQSSGVTANLWGVSGIPGSTVFVSGYSGTLLRYY